MANLTWIIWVVTFHFSEAISQCPTNKGWQDNTRQRSCRNLGLWLWWLRWGKAGAWGLGSFLGVSRYITILYLYIDIIFIHVPWLPSIEISDRGPLKPKSAFFFVCSSGAKCVHIHHPRPRVKSSRTCMLRSSQGLPAASSLQRLWKQKAWPKLLCKINAVPENVW